MTKTLKMAVRSSAEPARRPRPRLSPRPTYNRRAVIRHILQGPRLQTKLRVGPTGDACEQEANRVAEAVMRMPASEERVQRECSECEETLQRQPEEEDEEELQRQPTDRLQTECHPGKEPRVGAALERRIDMMRGGGRPLPGSVRTFFEQRLGRDFADVRVHAGTAAADIAGALRARAFTIGQDVVFGAGQYAPESPSGRRLVAHELTHVIQQKGGRS